MPIDLNPKVKEFGIQWGAATLNCLFSDKNTQSVTFGLYTHKREGNDMIQIYVTKTGKVRIHDKNGEWMPPKKKEKCTS